MLLVHSFVRAGDYTKRAESDPIAEFLIGGYLKGDWDEIIVFSTTFVTALRQDVMQRQLLPISFEKIRETAEEIIPRAGRYSHYLDPDVFDLKAPLPSITSESRTDVTRSLPLSSEGGSASGGENQNAGTPGSQNPSNPPPSGTVDADYKEVK